jgi:Protein of unknown function (DUF3455)
MWVDGFERSEKMDLSSRSGRSVASGDDRCSGGRLASQRIQGMLQSSNVAGRHIEKALCFAKRNGTTIQPWDAMAQRLTVDDQALFGELPSQTIPSHREHTFATDLQRSLSMKTQRVFTTSMTVPAALLAGCFTGSLVGCATSPVPPPMVPESLRVPADQSLSLETQAVGVQIYKCEVSKTDATRYEWVFSAPEAELFDRAGSKIGKHYAGPTWESNDASKVVGQLKAKDDSPDPNAIPWLLLSAKSTSGKGVFGQTLSIQRLRTSGGKAPGDGCSAAQVGNEARVPYKATYYFYVARS